jgi:hypothetical protein
MRRQLLPPNPSESERLIFFDPHHDGTAVVAPLATPPTNIAAIPPTAAATAATPRIFRFEVIRLTLLG